MKVFQVLGKDIKEIEFACDRVDWKAKLFWRNGARHSTQTIGTAIFETERGAAAYVIKEAEDYVKLTGSDLQEAEAEYAYAKENLKDIQKQYKHLL